MKTDTTRILLYHAVREDADFPTTAGTNVTPSAFEAQMAFLAERFEVLSLEEALADGSRRTGRPAAAVTFDDGYEDTYSIAYPLLKKHAIPVTFFLTVSQVGRDWTFPGGPYPGLSWKQVLEMAEDPLVSFGSHGCRHLDLTRLSPGEAADEILKSKEILEEKLSRPVPFFSYPHGSFNDGVRETVRRAGYAAALSVISGGRDRYCVRRILISRDDTIYRFRVKLSRLYWPLRRLC